MSQVTFDEVGANDQPSPSIWKDCPGPTINQDGEGYYFHEEFLGNPLVNTTITAALLARLRVGKDLNVGGDDDTVITNKVGEIGGYMDVETDGDDNDAVAIFSEPFGKIVLNSGNKVWFEARLELGALADQGLFIGLAEKAALSLDVVADNTITLIGESLVGFQILSSDTDGVDAVYKLDGGTVVVVKADASFTGSASGFTPFHLAADTEFKIGLKFDGGETIAFYVNGYKVATLTVVSTTFPVGVLLGAIIGFKTGSGAAVSYAVDWMRAAYSNRR